MSRLATIKDSAPVSPSISYGPVGRVYLVIPLGIRKLFVAVSIGRDVVMDFLVGYAFGLFLFLAGFGLFHGFRLI